MVGQGQAANLDVAGQLGNSGILVVAGVQSQLSLAGDLDLSGNTSLLAALSPNAYSTASLTIGGAFSVADRQQHVLLGHAGGQHDQQHRRHDQGQRHARRHRRHQPSPTPARSRRWPTSRWAPSGWSSPTTSAGTGTLTIDAGATLVLNGAVNDQTINFVANSATPARAVSLFAQHAGAEGARQLYRQQASTASPSPTGWCWRTSRCRRGADAMTGTDADGEPGRRLDAQLRAAGSGGISPVSSAQARQSGTSVVVSFVAPSGGIAPGVSCPARTAGTLARCAVGTAGARARRRPADAARRGRQRRSATYSVTVDGQQRHRRDRAASRPSMSAAAPAVTIPNVATTTPTGLATTLAQLEQYLQTLTYQARGTAADTITITVTDPRPRSGLDHHRRRQQRRLGRLRMEPAPAAPTSPNLANWTRRHDAAGRQQHRPVRRRQQYGDGRRRRRPDPQLRHDHAHRQHHGPGHRRPRGRRRQRRRAHAHRRRAVSTPSSR